MNWFETIAAVIDLRSFSSLWYWIGLAVYWAYVSQRIMGVPYDVIVQASRGDGAAVRDLEALLTFHVNRILYVAAQAGLWLIGLVCFVLTILAVLGFAYRVEFAQALLFLALPAAVVAGLNLSLARALRSEPSDADDVCLRLRRHRTLIHAIGLVAIFFTALWGMSQNLGVGHWGG